MRGWAQGCEQFHSSGVEFYSWGVEIYSSGVEISFLLGKHHDKARKDSRLEQFRYYKYNGSPDSKAPGLLEVTKRYIILKNNN